EHEPLENPGVQPLSDQTQQHSVTYPSAKDLPEVGVFDGVEGTWRSPSSPVGVSPRVVHRNFGLLHAFLSGQACPAARAAVIPIGRVLSRTCLSGLAQDGGPSADASPAPIRAAAHGEPSVYAFFRRPRRAATLPRRPRGRARRDRSRTPSGRGG